MQTCLQDSVMIIFYSFSLQCVQECLCYVSMPQWCAFVYWEIIKFSFITKYNMLELCVRSLATCNVEMWARSIITPGSVICVIQTGIELTDPSARSCSLPLLHLQQHNVTLSPHTLQRFGVGVFSNTEMFFFLLNSIKINYSDSSSSL